MRRMRKPPGFFDIPAAQRTISVGESHLNSRVTFGIENNRFHCPSLVFDPITKRLAVRRYLWTVRYKDCDTLVLPNWKVTA